jgi:histidine phosphotransferase ChpT
MVEDDGLKFAELLCARVCHDLAGPVGAVGTGAELLAEEDMGAGMAGEALSLLASSAATAGSRLRFLRVALGSGAAAMTSSQLRELAVNFLASPVSGSEGLRVDWQEDGEAGMWNSGPAKLLLNMIVLARDCLPRGGAVLVRTQADGQCMVVSAEGLGAVPGASVAALTASGLDALDARGIQGYYTSQLAKRLGLIVTVTVEPGKVWFSTA